MDVRVMNRRVQMQLVVGISQLCSGAVPMDARGVNQLVQWQL